MNLPDHTGETCIIIGNGPSLADVPAEFLRSAPTFGANYINRLPWQPDYYVCIDTRVLTVDVSKIYDVAAAAKMAFISSYVPQNPELAKLRRLKNVYHVGQETFVFSNERYMSGNTCVYVELKIAYFMGFTTALLVGVDHTCDGTHFTDDYPAPNGPNYEGQRYHFAIARDAWHTDGRKIINLSPPSLLDAIFARGELTKA